MTQKINACACAPTGLHQVSIHRLVAFRGESDNLLAALDPVQLGHITGVTGLKIIRAILKGRRDPKELAALRDRRCHDSVAEIAAALDGRYRPEHLLELRCSLEM